MARRGNVGETAARLFAGALLGLAAFLGLFWLSSVSYDLVGQANHVMALFIGGFIGGIATRAGRPLAIGYLATYLILEGLVIAVLHNLTDAEIPPYRPEEWASLGLTLLGFGAAAAAVRFRGRRHDGV
jgi:hypothetical protein